MGVGRLNDISVAIVDCPHSTAKFVATGQLCIDTNSFKSGRLLPHKLRYVDEATFAARIARLQPQPGDLVFAREGSVGESIIIPDGVVACLGQRVMLFRFSESVSKEFVRLAMSSNGFIGKLLELHKGIGAKHVNVSDMRLALVPLPPLAEQSRIVTRVEELMQLCDALEAKGRLEAAQHAQLVSTLLGALTASATPEELADHWQRVAQHFDLLLDRPEAIDALEQTLLQLAVRGLLVPQDPQDEPASALLERIRTEKDRLIAEGKIKRDKPLGAISDEEKPFGLPVGWEWVHVGDVVEMLNGYAFKSEWFKQAGTRLLRNVNVAHGHVDWSTSAFIDSALANEFDQFALNEGDVVLTLDRPIISTGLKLAVLRKQDLPCLLLQRVARLSPDAQALSQEFLVLWMQSDAFVGTLDPGRSNGVPHISTKQVASMAFPLPPLPEQARIVARVASLRRLCADLRQRLAASQSTQAQLAEALVASVVG